MGKLLRVAPLSKKSRIAFGMDFGMALGVRHPPYSHSMVAGGLELMS